MRVMRGLMRLQERLEALKVDTVTFHDRNQCNWIAVGVGHGSVWAALWQGELVQMDPATGVIQARFALERNGAMDIAVTDDAIWVLGQRLGGSWLARFDPVDPAGTTYTPIPDLAVRVVADELGVVVGSTERASGETYGTIVTIDPATGEVTGTARTPTRPEGLALAGDFVWTGAAARTNCHQMRASSPMTAQPSNGLPRCASGP